jgi:hypothetical protein
MADRTFYTNECALNEAAAVAKTVADSKATPATIGKLRFFDNTIVANVATLKTDLEAAEITLAGYPPGGYPVDDMTGPLLSPVGGGVITTPMVNVSFASGPAITAGGAWLEDGGGAIRCIFVFDPVRTLASLGDGFEFVRQLVYGRNA